MSEIIRDGSLSVNGPALAELRMAELRKALLNLSPDHNTTPPYFQLLLTSTVENGVPGKSSLIALRIVPN